MNCVRCPRCENYFHTDDAEKNPHDCKLFAVEYREHVTRAEYEPALFGGEWSSFESWARNAKEAFRNVMLDRFFRESRWERSCVNVEMRFKGRTYRGQAFTRTEIKVRKVKA